MKLVTIATFTLQQELLLSKGKLEAMGIESFAQSSTSSQMNNSYSNAFGGVKLQVKAQDVNQAVDILTHTPPAELSVKNALLTCQNCGSSQITGIGLNGMLSGFFSKISGARSTHLTTKYHCKDCDSTFTIKHSPTTAIEL